MFPRTDGPKNSLKTLIPSTQAALSVSAWFYLACRIKLPTERCFGFKVQPLKWWLLLLY